MRKATMKIRSQRGASLSFSLMLFLVCAMASAVAIVSATASSGWMARVAETDQRYYAVNSAAYMLKEQLDGQTVEFVETRTVESVMDCDDNGAVAAGATPKKQTTTVKTSVWCTPNGNPAEAATMVGVEKTISKDTTKSEISDSEIIYALSTPGASEPSLPSPLIGAACYIYGITTEGITITADADGIYKNNSSITTAGNDKLNVSIQEMVKEPEAGEKKSTFYIRIWKEKEEGSNLAYALEMTFVAQNDDPVINDKTSQNKEIVNIADHTKTITQTTKKTKTLKWELVSINKSSKPTSPAAGGGTP